MSRPSVTYDAVTRQRGENLDARLPMRRQEQWADHAAFMDVLADDGFVVLGGPLGEGEKGMSQAPVVDQKVIGVRHRRPDVRRQGRLGDSRGRGVQPLGADTGWSMRRGSHI